MLEVFGISLDPLASFPRNNLEHNQTTHLKTSSFKVFRNLYFLIPSQYPLNEYPHLLLIYH
jgi:hypothetical protein